MDDIGKDIKRARLNLRTGPKEKSNLSIEKPFAQSMYLFTLFMVNYYSRVREKLKLDYDSFMIVQTCVLHTVYHIGKSSNTISRSYSELEKEWEKIKHKTVSATNAFDNYAPSKHNKLSISSICLVTNQPKETVRRKTNELVEMNLLKISKKDGIVLGKHYAKIFKEFVPQTTHEVSKVIKFWDKNGVLKNIINL